MGLPSRGVSVFTKNLKYIKRSRLILAYIYQITNKINGKIYIGKTEFSVQKRFKEHCSDAFKQRNEKRPLYAAMRKYGIENFEVSLLEETNNPNEREIFWIEQKGSFKYGYNATIGGEGTKYIDYDLVVATYQKTNSVIETAKILNMDDHHCSDILKKCQIKVLPSSQVIKNKQGILVGMFDKDNQKLLKSFSSYNEAGQWLINNNLSNCKISTIRTHISEVCNNKRKSAAGYIWKKL